MIGFYTALLGAAGSVFYWVYFAIRGNRLSVQSPLGDMSISLADESLSGTLQLILFNDRSLTMYVVLSLGLLLMTLARRAISYASREL